MSTSSVAKRDHGQRPRHTRRVAWVLGWCVGLMSVLLLARTASALLNEAADTTQAQPPAAYAKGQLIVKYKDSVTECVHCLLKAHQLLKPATTDASDSLDTLHAKYNVTTATPIFRTETEEAAIAGTKTTTALKQYDQAKIAAVKQQFAARATRAPQDAVSPDLSHVYVLDVPEETDIAAAAAEFSQDPHVEYAEPNYIAYAEFVPNDPYYASTGSWEQPYRDLWGLQKIQAESAWDFSNGLDIIVAVVDTGLDYTHSDIDANVWMNAWEIAGNGLDDDGNGFIDDVRGWDFYNNDNNPMDDNGHGTHVSGTIGAEGNNGLGVIGVAHRAKIMGVKSLNAIGAGTADTLAAGITYAAQKGADVINMSFGGLGGAAETEAIQAAYTLGVVMVAAAGNKNANAQINSPANLPQVITVAASDQNDAKTYFSSFGSKIDVTAPGGGTTAEPPSFAPHKNILSLKASVCNAATCDPNLIVGTNYLRIAGTSMASPHVAGVAALVLAAHPTLTVEQVRQVLRMSATDVGTPGWDPYAGFGRLNASQAVLKTQVPTATLNLAHEQELAGALTVTGSFSAAPGLTVQRYTLSYTTPTNATPVILQDNPNPAGQTFAVPWNVSQLPMGTYWLKLAVTQSDGQVAVDVRQLNRRLYQDISTTAFPATSSQSTWVFKAADVDGDGDFDLFEGNILGPPENLLNPTQHLWLNDGSGHFTDGAASRLPNGGQGALNIRVGAFLDIERDGDPDLVLVTGFDGLQLWVNNGTGYFIDASAARVPGMSFVTANAALDVGDVDADEDSDIVVADELANGGHPALLINDGQGYFADQQSSRAPWLSAARGYDVKLADVNQDGVVDLLVARYGPTESLAMGLNDGTGHFDPTPQQLLNTVNEVGVADFTGDGFADLIVTTAWETLLLVNNGAGTSWSPASGALPAELAAFSGLIPIPIDINLDEAMDLLLLRPDAYTPASLLLQSNETGIFSDQSPQYLGFPQVPVRSDLVDVTGDGLPDLLISNQYRPKELRKALWADYHIGDVNLDGAVTAADISLITQFAAGDIVLTPEQQFRAKVALPKPNVSSLDVKVVVEALAGKISRLPVLFGDVTWDGRIMMDDMQAITESLIGGPPLTDDQRYQADVDRNGVVNIFDALRIGQYASGLIPNLLFDVQVYGNIKFVNCGSCPAAGASGEPVIRKTQQELGTSGKLVFTFELVLDSPWDLFTETAYASGGGGGGTSCAVTYCPLANRAVEVRDPQTSAVLRSCSTDATGNYNCQHVPSASSYSVCVSTATGWYCDPVSVPEYATEVRNDLIIE